MVARRKVSHSRLLAASADREPDDGSNDSALPSPARNQRLNLVSIAEPNQPSRNTQLNSGRNGTRRSARRDVVAEWVGGGWSGKQWERNPGQEEGVGAFRV